MTSPYIDTMAINGCYIFCDSPKTINLGRIPMTLPDSTATVRYHWAHIRPPAGFADVAILADTVCRRWTGSTAPATQDHRSGMQYGHSPSWHCRFFRLLSGIGSLLQAPCHHITVMPTYNPSSVKESVIDEATSLPHHTCRKRKQWNR